MRFKNPIPDINSRITTDKNFRVHRSILPKDGNNNENIEETIRGNLIAVLALFIVNSYPIFCFSFGESAKAEILLE